MHEFTNTLVERARTGDVRAFEVLVREHAGSVHRLAYAILGDHHDAQDVAQRAMLSAWQGLPSFRGEAAFPTWLHQITRRHALNYLTRGPLSTGVDVAADRPDPDPEPAEAAVLSEQAHTVTAAVAALPDQQRRVVGLHHFGGLSYAQIARTTGSSVPAVRSHLFRARRVLAHALADQVS